MGKLVWRGRADFGYLQWSKWQPNEAATPRLGGKFIVELLGPYYRQNSRLEVEVSRLAG